MAIIQVKKYKIIKDEKGNKMHVPKTKEEWNKETRNGTMTWYFSERYKIDNTIKQYKSMLFMLKREAEEERRLFLLNPIEYIRNNSKKAKNKLSTMIETKKKILNDYYENFFVYDLTINKESTVYGHKKNYYKHIAPLLGNIPPEDINIKSIDKFHEELNKTNLNNNTKVNINSSLKCLLDFLKMKGIIEINYASVYGSFKKVNNEIRPIKKEIKYQTLEEYEKFISVVDDLFWKTFFNFVFWHGLRKGEQQALKWEDIDFKNNAIIINKTIAKSKNGGCITTTTKNKKNRIIYLAEQSKQQLLEYKDFIINLDGYSEKWYVFGTETYVARNTIDRKLKYYYNILEQKSDKPINILTHHEFGRHSHASYLLNKGMGRQDIYAIIGLRLGDSEEVIREAYAHPYEDLNNDKTKDLLSL